MPTTRKGVHQQAALRKPVSYVVDCSKPVDDRIMDLDAFKRFLAENIKLNGKKGELGDAIKVTMDRTKVTVTTHVAMSKRYIKYLTRKFLKKHNVRDWLRIVASNKDRNVYDLRYFNISSAAAEEEED